MFNDHFINIVNKCVIPSLPKYMSVNTNNSNVIKNLPMPLLHIKRLNEM